jgi:hypothetical protein
MMITSLDDTETICLNILKKLDELPHGLPVEDVKERMAGIQRDIAVAKKKIMMRSAEGVEISEAVKKSALKLEGALSGLSKKTNPKVVGNLSTSLSGLLKELESDVSKATIYWRSFESVIT